MLQEVQILDGQKASQNKFLRQIKRGTCDWVAVYNDGITEICLSLLN